MMVVDTSALLAILLGEPETRSFVDKIDTARTRLLSSASFIESSIILERRKGDVGVMILDNFISRSNMEIVAIDTDQTEIARTAFRRFGKGRHRAGLNFGDCFSYALAKATGEPLLFKGNDFQHTDIEVIT